MVPYTGKIHLMALVQFGGGYFETMSLCGSGLEKLPPPRTIRRAGNPCGKRRELYVHHHMRDMRRGIRISRGGVFLSFH
jgi:hypothetical protein